jgi:hypothetical protein
LIGGSVSDADLWRSVSLSGAGPTGVVSTSRLS